MSIFDDAEDLLAETLGAVFDERVRVIPLADSRVVKGGPDPDRAPYEARAIIDETARPSAPVGEGARGGTRVDHMVAVVEMVLDLDLVPTGALPPRKGDEIIALDRAGEPAFRVVNTVPLGTHCLTLALQRVAE